MDMSKHEYSCLENLMDGGAWWAAVHGVAKSRTRLSDFTFTFHFHAVQRRPEVAVEGVDLVLAHPRPLLQVGAGAEGAVARAGEDHAAHRAPLRHPRQLGEEPRDHGAGERVPARRAVDGPDLGRAEVFDDPLRHGGPPPPTVTGGAEEIHRQDAPSPARTVREASSACSAFPGSGRPTSRCASSPAAMSSGQSTPVSYPMPCSM